MAQLSGKLTVQSDESELQGETLARRNTNRPLPAATDFLARKGFVHGMDVTVTGDRGKVNEMDVFFITKAESPAAPAAKKAAKKAVKKAAKKNK